ncbi:uncharacterized protein [Venturia canescens]|uniref:uncharacterized protein isoform X2 n=1 Tax=Venturia canescens TaxID=32260 RepID=UPI001C9BF304|nr:uncharacterized protein LOC122410706 isoform X2 [Venturia canescens]
MGKTPKKAAPGGDERNLYVRRLKTTSALSSKGSMRQRESDNSNRAKLVGVQKQLPVPVTKVFKPTTSKEEKKLTSITSKSQDTESGTMHTGSEESAVQLRVSITKKDVKEESGKNSADDDVVKGVEESINHSSTNGKEIVELTETENTPREETPKETASESIEEKSTNEKSSTEIEKQENGDLSFEALKNEDQKEEIETAGSESEESFLKLIDEPEVSKSTDENLPTEECTTNGDNKGEKIEETVALSKVIENSSNEVVESTTGETLDSGNISQSDKEAETTDQDTANRNIDDASFVSYDSSIMLKDVQIKLNDCLKDNSKLFDVSNAEDPVPDEPPKRVDMSFGKTLRNISGRSTINRLRYITVRESRFSPNSSLFVNTSSVSLDQDDPASSKLSRYPSELSDAILCNGSPADRKRKMTDNEGASFKKLKTESSSNFFNTSLELLKGLRRPVEVSTPNAQGYNFQTDESNFKGFNDDKLTSDPEVEPKKWCVVM